MRTVPDPEAVARGLVLSIRPALAERMRRGEPCRAVLDAAQVEHYGAWTARHGAYVALRARTILDSLGAAMVLTPYGLDLFMREGPVEAIAAPVEAIAKRA